MSNAVIKGVAWVVLAYGMVVQVCAYADPVIQLHDNERRVLSISRSSMTHLTLDQDRIASVRGLSERYQLQLDERHGDIYILPTRWQGGNFSLFITTEKGHRFIVYCRLTSCGSQSIVLRVSGRNGAAEATPLVQTAHASLTTAPLSFERDAHAVHMDLPRDPVVGASHE